MKRKIVSLFGGILFEVQVFADVVGRKGKRKKRSLRNLTDPVNCYFLIS